MKKIIPYGRQHITEADLHAVQETLLSDFLTQGPKIQEFESAFANYVGSTYAVALSNGTAALHLSVMALGIQKDEYVICSPITFSASANCVRYCGANVLFADIDPETYLLDIESVKNVIAENSDKKIRGIIPVDFAGRVVDLEAFRQLADEHDLWILEDACHAPGGFFLDHKKQKQRAGNGKFADASIFSFHPVKHIATGEGGMITTDNKRLYEHLLELRTHGITRNRGVFENSIEWANGNAEGQVNDYPAWYMEMRDLGYNYRITDVQCSLGIKQLERADEGLKRRRSIAKKYTDELSGTSGIISCSGAVEGHAYHLYVLEVMDRRGLYDHLRQQGIYCQVHYVPVHLMPYYKRLGWKLGDLPNAEEYYSRCLSVPMFPTLTDEEQNYVIEQIKWFYQRS